MIIICIILWITAILVIYANPKTVWAWWAFSFLGLNGLGCISSVISDNILPVVVNNNSDNLIFLCILGQGLTNALEHNLSAYALLGFILYFTNFLDVKINIITRHIIMTLLAIPGTLLFILYPVNPYFKPNYTVESVYVVTYTILSGIILIISIFKEKDDIIKYQKILAFIITIPAYLAVAWTSYIAVALGYNNLWYSNVWIIICVFSIFVFHAFKCGILGVRLKVERPMTDETIDMVGNGINAVSHAIKNEVSTINICVDLLRNTQELDVNAYKKLGIIKESCKNLSEFTQRINKYTILQMDIKPFPVSLLIEKAVNQVMPMIYDKNIKIYNRSNLDVTILIDEMHISEVLKNLLINAIEAISLDGTIEIQTDIVKDNFCLSVIDNGLGISKEACEKVFTPFYSTKKGKNNYGLGLSYCYKVMKYHNGGLKISSIVNEGTTMTLLFPIGTVLNVSKKITIGNKL